MMLAAAKRPNATKRADDTGPTPETARKLRADPFWLLYVRGRLDRKSGVNRQLWDAGLEVREAYRLVTAEVAMKGTDYERVPVKGNTEEWTHWQIEIVRQYDRWAAILGTLNLPLGPVVDLIVEGLSTRAIEKKWGRRNGWAAVLVAAALWLYVREKA